MDKRRLKRLTSLDGVSVEYRESELNHSLSKEELLKELNELVDDYNSGLENPQVAEATEIPRGWEIFF
ncbi:MAG: hypothetical protein PHW53_02250 [Patescibacteria group bacterium]|nr:hypothetical protein [Patescibacteria group bacterium]